MHRASLVAVVACTASIANAQSTIEPYIKMSFLALSAFECAVVAPNDREAKRLFTLGLKAGREFIAFAQADIERYQRAVRPKVAILWNLTRGPSPDFVLGRIYADREQEIYKEFTIDNDLWKLKRENMYRAKNCALISGK